MAEVEIEQLSHQQLQELIEGKLGDIQSAADYWEVTQGGQKNAAHLISVNQYKQAIKL